MTRRSISCIAFLALSRAAFAQEPDGGVVDGAASEPAPPADQASGVAVPEQDRAEALRRAGRVLLFPLRVATEIAFAPLRGAAWTYERYQLKDRFLDIFFNDEGTFGIFPTAFIETGAGLDVGARLIHRDLFGHGEHLSVAAGFGGEFKQKYEASFTSGALFAGTSHLKVHADYRAWDRSNFFGIGNADLTNPMMTTSIDVFDDPTAVQTRFAQDVVHGDIRDNTRLRGPLSADAMLAFTARTFSADADLEGHPRTIDRYNPEQLVGYTNGAQSFYYELGLTLDTLTFADRYISLATPSSGWRVSGFGGWAQGISGDPSNYLRYGFDARRYLNLYRGDRVLLLRAYLEGVTADLDQIPFTDLPRLGGTEMLRGFHHDRFRDRVAGVGSAEYRFPVQEGIAAYLFLDAGRVARELSDMDPSGLHYGYGGGIQLHTMRSVLMRFQVAGSSEGVFIRFALDPAQETRTKNMRL